MHPIISQRILAESSSFSPYIMSGVLHHHRNLDGTGYPESDEEPNDYARITNIVSTYTAMRWRSLPIRQILRARVLSSRSLLASLTSPIIYPFRYLRRATSGLTGAFDIRARLWPGVVLSALSRYLPVPK